MNRISAKDRHILRELARRQLEHATSPRNRTLIDRWYRHNAYDCGEPTIHLELMTFQNEVIPPRLRCEGEAARALETRLYGSFLNFELFGDDFPIPDYYPVHWRTGMTPFGLEVSARHAKAAADGSLVGYEYDHPIRDLEEDFGLLGDHQYHVDRQGTAEALAVANETFGDILPTRLVGKSLVASPTGAIVKLMGMETMFLSMYDYPALFHHLMEMLADGYIGYFRFLEREQLLLPTTGNEELIQGSWCFTKELPNTVPAGGLTSREVWGYMDSQETVGVSPDMFEEFIFPSFRRIAGEYGLLSYGCCEPVHALWDSCLSKLQNLRKLSVSPWCDEEAIGERLRGKGVIYHRKPSPNFIGVEVNLDEEAVRAHFRKTLRAARGLTLEIAQRDVYTIHHNEAKARRYVEIIREEIANHWG